MASIVVSDDNPNQQQESLIPVLTVFKNNSILKNIIILNNNNNDDQILLVGRHPNCNIVLFHPSISRFHLQIRFTPSSRSISLLDLSSVHGTWVCGNKLEHGVSVDLKEGDNFQLGSSSRVYLLQFVSQFDDVDALKNIGSLCCDDERKNQSNEETFEDENDAFGTETSCCNGENKLCGCHICLLSPPYAQSVHEADNTEMIEACPEVEMPGETNFLCTLRECFKQNICIPVAEVVQGSKLHQQSSAEKQLIDPAASFDEKGDAFVDVMPKDSEFEGTFEYVLTTGASVFNSEDMPDSEYHQTNNDEEVFVDSLSDEDKQGSCGEEYELELQNQSASSCHEQEYSPDEIVEDVGKKCIENMDPASSDENGVAAVNVTPKEHKLEFFFEENDRIDDISTGMARLFTSENTSSLVEEAIPVIDFQQITIVEESAVVDSLSDEENENKCDEEFKAYLNVNPCDEEGNSPDEIVEETVKSFQTEESLNTSVTQEADLEVTDKKENQTPQSLVAVAGCFDVEFHESYIEQSAERCSTFGSDILARRDKAASAPQDRSRKSRLLNTPNVDTKFVMSNLKDINIINKSMPKNLFSVLDEGEMFTPNKENSSPANTFRLQFMRKKGVLEESKSSKSQRSHNLKASFSPIICSAERSTSAISNKENQTPREAQEWKSQRSHNLKANFSPIIYSAERSTISNKENLTPREAQEWKSQRSNNLRASFSPIIYSAERSSSAISNKENLTPREAQEWKSQRSLNLRASFSPIIDSAERRASAISNKDNLTPREAREWKSQRLLNLRASFSPIIDSAERSASAISNKENLTPREAQEWKSQRSHNLRASFSPIVYSAERSASAISNKENLTPKEALEWMSGRKPLECRNTTELRKKRVERIPLQSLMSSGGNHNSENSSSFPSSPFSAAKSIVGAPARASNCGHVLDKHAKPSRISEERKRSWDLVVETSSFLNKESRKALQLLQGLKGTRLIIPQSVIRELGSMKQQSGIFRRISEAALALEWIEECIGKTKWWIHIQSSMEDEFNLIAPTPQTQFNEECILDCALQHRRKDNVGQIVLLSDDVNLKIKSMAKGLLCETVQQFRRSLVNPFSERFMWANSSPRGLTWSCQDDVVLREKYCCLPSKAGLKLLAT